MGDDDKKEKEARLLSVSWNQDASCFSAATTADFRVFDVHPFREKLRRVSEDGGGIAAAEMLYRSNIFAVVPSDRSVVEGWDDARRKPIWQLGYSTNAVVRSVRLSRNRVAVAFERMVRVYDLLEPRRPAMCKAETAPNLRGLLCLSCCADASTVVACPGTARGQVRVQHLDKDDAARFVITAHSSDLACMATTVDGPRHGQRQGHTRQGVPHRRWNVPARGQLFDRLFTPLNLADQCSYTYAYIDIN
jgi:WD repeat-containing protein 45